MKRPLLIVTLSLLVLTLSACGASSAPALAAKTFFETVANGGAVDSLYCTNAVWPDGTSIKDSLDQLRQTISTIGGKIDASGLKFETQNQSTDTADVKISGTFKVTNGDKSIESPLPDGTLKMRLENGSWKVCGAEPPPTLTSVP